MVLSRRKGFSSKHNLKWGLACYGWTNLPLRSKIVYSIQNGSSCENMNILEKHIFCHKIKKKIKVFKTETAVCHPTHIYLISTILQVQIIV